jgi:hypothetical protein
LFQTCPRADGGRVIAVLEQPSSRRMAQSALGRRNIALQQSSELNASGTQPPYTPRCANASAEGSFRCVTSLFRQK